MKYSLLFCFTFVLLAVDSTAQIQRKKGQIEKEKRLNKRYYDEVYGEGGDEGFLRVKTPSRYEEESAVILYQEYNYWLTRKGRGLFDGSDVLYTLTRKRVLLNHISAIIDFSELYFGEGDYVGMKVVKANGEEYVVPIVDAIHVTTKVPKFYADSYKSTNYYKIAIPNLEVGDILEYFSSSMKGVKSSFEIFRFLDSQYPIVGQKNIFKFKRKHKFMKFNSSVEFEKISEKKKGWRSVLQFHVIDSMRDATKVNRWDIRRLTAPSFKLYLTTPSSYEIETKRKINDKSFLMLPYFVDYALVIKLRNIELDGMSIIEKCDSIYYALKDQVISMKFRASAGLFKDKSYWSGKTDLDFDGLYYFDSFSFSNLFIRFLKKNDIEAKLVITVSKKRGVIDESFFFKEFEYGVYVPSMDAYFWTVNNYSLPGDNNINTEGQKGYSVNKFRGIKGVEPIMIPYSSIANSSYTKLRVDVRKDGQLKFNASLRFEGELRKRNCPLFLYGMGQADLKRHKKIVKKGLMLMPFREERIPEEKLIDIRQEAMTEWLESNYKLDTLLTHSVSPFSEIKKTSELTAKFEFLSTEYIHQAGEDYIFDIGALISGQVALSKEEILERKIDAYLGYAKSFFNDIEIVIPEGYECKGLEKLNRNVSNDQGAFLSTATLNGNVITLKTSKIYKTDKVLLKDWPKLVEMLEAAYQFSQQKVVLKKIQ